MLPKKHFFYLILSLIILQSCASNNRNIFYVPEEHNMLMLAKKNDLKAAASTSNFTNENVKELSHINAQIGYSPIKHLGIFGSYLDWNSGSTYNDFRTGQLFDGKTNYNFASAAIGGYYFFPNDRQKMKDDNDASLPTGFLYDIYVGAGRGKVTNDYPRASNSLLEFNKTYWQVGIHWQEKYVGLSMVGRFGQINFIEGVLNGDFEEAHHYFNHLKENQKQKIREASFKLFVGPKEVRGYISVTMVNINEKIPIDNSIFFISDGRLPYIENVINIGVNLGIDEIYKYLKKM